MQSLRNAALWLGVVLFSVNAVCTDGLAQELPPGDGLLADSHTVAGFMQAHNGAAVSEWAGRINQVYGAAFSNGGTPQASAEQFRLNHAGMFGVEPGDLHAVGPFTDGRHTQPIMLDPQTGQYKFTGVYYTQYEGEVPVFRSALKLLVRNEQNYPLVLANADLRDLGDFQVAGAGKPNEQAAFQQAAAFMNDQPVFNQPRTVIWAGVDDMVGVQPALAIEFIGESGDAAVGTYQKRLFICDAATGAILYTEDMVHHVNVSGNVSGMATEGNAADTCDNESLAPLPYARVNIGSTFAFADANGNFTIPNAGSAPVNVDVAVRGQFFVVDNVTQTDSTLSQTVTPPGPANFVFNAQNNDEFKRAEVNAYLHANIVRDYALAQNPDFPVIADQTEWPVNVNINNNCNAFYNYSSINFYIAGGNCTNTANSTVVYHEYGHHLVSSGGSGQGAYGEGMADCVAVVVTDDSCLGSGFNAPCGQCLRNADNDCQYLTSGCSTCGSAIHSCGKLISGCVWSTRTNLQTTNPSTYRELISSLTINSILLHNGTTITPAITVDFLTLDDDNGDIFDGTPHYTEINDGFAAHSMPGPALSPLKFVYPNGRPQLVDPAGGTTLRVEVLPLTGTPQPGSGQFFVDTGSGFVEAKMNEVSANVYDAVFPASTCGTQVRYYISAESTQNQTVLSPGAAPATVFDATSAAGLGTLAFDDNFQADTGWTVTNNGLSAGAWERDVPITNCSRGNPLFDADESGACYLTQNDGGPVGDECNTDIDNGTTTLTSPNMNATQAAPILTYWRWYDNIHPNNNTQDDAFVVQFSINGGTNWQTLETVGPAGPETDGEWFHKQFALETVPGFQPTSQFKVRFIAQDLGGGSVVEAGVDGVQLRNLDCEGELTADVNNDGVVDIDDLFAVIAAWGPCAGCPEDITGDGNVNIDDLFAVLAEYGMTG